MPCTLGEGCTRGHECPALLTAEYAELCWGNPLAEKERDTHRLLRWTAVSLLGTVYLSIRGVPVGRREMGRMSGRAAAEARLAVKICESDHVQRSKGRLSLWKGRV